MPTPPPAFEEKGAAYGFAAKVTNEPSGVKHGFVLSDDYWAIGPAAVVADQAVVAVVLNAAQYYSMKALDLSGSLRQLGRNAPTNA